MYKIIGVYQGSKEIVDRFDTLEEAKEMLIEYKMAYGNDWRLYIK